MATRPDKSWEFDELDDGSLSTSACPPPCPAPKVTETPCLGCAHNRAAVTAPSSSPPSLDTIHSVIEAARTTRSRIAFATMSFSVASPMHTVKLSSGGDWGKRALDLQSGRLSRTNPPLVQKHSRLAALLKWANEECDKRASNMDRRFAIVAPPCHCRGQKG